MNTCKVRNLEIGSGIPKICVPIVEKTLDEIIKSAKNIKKEQIDLVEWRVDWFEYIDDIEKTIEVLKKLRNVLEDTPILFTFRTSKEGGEKEISEEEYVKLNNEVSKTGLIDLVDVEVFTGNVYVREIVKNAHDNRVKVVGSNHDFDKTPSKNEIVNRLKKMQELEVDIPKIAVMPNSRKDVLTLLSATEEMYSNYADRPIVTISMAGLGAVSRLSGQIFGSSITFGALGKASAPGQVKIEDLRNTLSLIGKSL